MFTQWTCAQATTQLHSINKLRSRISLFMSTDDNDQNYCYLLDGVLKLTLQKQYGYEFYYLEVYEDYQCFVKNQVIELFVSNSNIVTEDQQQQCDNANQSKSLANCCCVHSQVSHHKHHNNKPPHLPIIKKMILPQCLFQINLTQLKIYFIQSQTHSRTAMFRFQNQQQIQLYWKFICWVINRQYNTLLDPIKALYLPNQKNLSFITKHYQSMRLKITHQLKTNNQYKFIFELNRTIQKCIQVGDYHNLQVAHQLIQKLLYSDDTAFIQALFRNDQSFLLIIGSFSRKRCQDLLSCYWDPILPLPLQNRYQLSSLISQDTSIAVPLQVRQSICVIHRITFFREFILEIKKRLVFESKLMQIIKCNNCMLVRYFTNTQVVRDLLIYDEQKWGLWRSNLKLRWDDLSQTRSDVYSGFSIDEDRESLRYQSQWERMSARSQLKNNNNNNNKQSHQQSIQIMDEQIEHDKIQQKRQKVNKQVQQQLQQQQQCIQIQDDSGNSCCQILSSQNNKDKIITNFNINNSSNKKSYKNNVIEIVQQNSQYKKQFNNSKNNNNSNNNNKSIIQIVLQQQYPYTQSLVNNSNDKQPQYNLTQQIVDSNNTTNNNNQQQLQHKQQFITNHMRQCRKRLMKSFKPFLLWLIVTFIKNIQYAQLKQQSILALFHADLVKYLFKNINRSLNYSKDYMININNINNNHNNTSPSQQRISPYSFVIRTQLYLQILIMMAKQNHKKMIAYINNAMRKAIINSKLLAQQQQQLFNTNSNTNNNSTINNNTNNNPQSLLNNSNNNNSIISRKQYKKSIKQKQLNPYKILALLYWRYLPQDQQNAQQYKKILLFYQYLFPQLGNQLHIQTFLQQFVQNCLLESIKFMSRDRVKLQSREGNNNNNNNNNNKSSNNNKLSIIPLRECRRRQLQLVQFVMKNIPYNRYNQFITNYILKYITPTFQYIQQEQLYRMNKQQTLLIFQFTKRLIEWIQFTNKQRQRHQKREYDNNRSNNDNRVDMSNCYQQQQQLSDFNIPYSHHNSEPIINHNNNKLNSSSSLLVNSSPYSLSNMAANNNKNISNQRNICSNNNRNVSNRKPLSSPLLSPTNNNNLNNNLLNNNLLNNNINSNINRLNQIINTLTNNINNNNDQPSTPLMNIHDLQQLQQSIYKLQLQLINNKLIYFIYITLIKQLKRKRENCVVACGLQIMKRLKNMIPLKYSYYPISYRSSQQYNSNRSNNNNRFFTNNNSNLYNPSNTNTSPLITYMFNLLQHNPQWLTQYIEHIPLLHRHLFMSFYINNNRSQQSLSLSSSQVSSSVDYSQSEDNSHYNYRQQSSNSSNNNRSNSRSNSRYNKSNNNINDNNDNSDSQSQSQSQYNDSDSEQIMRRHIQIEGMIDQMYNRKQLQQSSSDQQQEIDQYLCDNLQQQQQYGVDKDHQVQFEASPSSSSQVQFQASPSSSSQVQFEASPSSSQSSSSSSSSSNNSDSSSSSNSPISSPQQQQQHIHYPQQPNYNITAKQLLKPLNKHKHSQYRQQQSQQQSFRQSSKQQQQINYNNKLKSSSSSIPQQSCNNHMLAKLDRIVQFLNKRQSLKSKQQKSNNQQPSNNKQQNGVNSHNQNKSSSQQQSQREQSQQSQNQQLQPQQQQQQQMQVLKQQQMQVLKQQQIQVLKQQQVQVLKEQRQPLLTRTYYHQASLSHLLLSSINNQQQQQHQQQQLQQQQQQQQSTPLNNVYQQQYKENIYQQQYKQNIQNNNQIQQQQKQQSPTTSIIKSSTNNNKTLIQQQTITQQQMTIQAFTHYQPTISTNLLHQQSIINTTHLSTRIIYKIKPIQNISTITNQYQQQSQQQQSKIQNIQ